MTTNQSAPRKRRGLLVIAIICLLAGGGVIYIGSRNFAIRIVGIGIVMASTYLVQVSNAQNGSRLSVAASKVNSRNSTNVSRRVLWIVSLCLAPILAGTWYLLHLDAMDGGQVAWPADLFAGVGLLCAAVWSLLVAVILRGRESRE